MTSKLRIILGFTFLTCMTIFLAFISYQSASESSKNLEEFLNFDSADSITYRTEIDIYKIAYHLDQFSLHQNQSDIDSVKASVKRALDDNKQLINIVPDKSKSKIQDIVTYLEQLNKSLDNYFTHSRELRKAITTDLVFAEKELMKALSDILHLMFNANDLEAIEKVNEAEREIINYQGHLEAYLLSQNQKSFEKAIEAEEILLEDINSILEMKDKHFFADITPFDSLESKRINFEEIAHKLEAESSKLAEEISELDTIRSNIMKIILPLSITAADGAKNELKAVTNLSQNASKQVLIISAIAVIVSALVTIIIVTKLSSTLTKMANYAQSIAQGRFDAHSGITEKGDIGLVLNGIKEITNTLTTLKEDFYTNANSVSSGYLASEIEKDKYNNSFADLANNFNIMASCYRKLIDTMSVAVFTATSDNTILYINEIGKKFIKNDNPLGTNCGNHFRSPACGNENCLGLTAFNKGDQINAIAPCLPNNEEYFFDVQASPLYDLNNQPIGYVEFLADITKVQKQGQAIKQMTDQAIEVAARVASAADELSSQTEYIVEGSNFQRERIESTSTAMTEMNASVQEVASNASNTADQSNIVLEKAREGITTILKMSEAMSSLTNSAENLKSNMEKLDSLSEGIGSIINVINDIADQTNLLALNAAIEAARAGEAGRGFAVVADEVRKLAEKTMDATREVGESVRSIQDSSNANQDEVKRVVLQITQTAEFAELSESSLQEIASVTGQNTDMIHQIANAAGEQTTVSEEISQSMSDINEVVNKNAEAILQSADAIRELAKQAQELQDSMSKVSF